MLLKPSFEAPYDSTEYMLKSGIIPINSNGKYIIILFSTNIEKDINTELEGSL